MAKKRRTELDIDPTLSLEPEAPPEPEPPAPEPEAEPAPEPQAKVNRLKLMMVAGAGLSLIIAAGLGIWGASRYFADPKMPKPQNIVTASDIPPLYQFKPFLVSVGDDDGATLVNINFAAEITEEKAIKEIDKNLIFIRENIFELLRAKSVAAYENEKNRRIVAGEVALALSRSIQSGEVTKVLITEVTIK